MTPTQYAALITSHLRLQLRDAYQRSGHSQTVIGRRIDKSPDWVARRLSGRNTLGAEDLILLAGALGIDPVAMLVKATKRADADRG